MSYSDNAIQNPKITFGDFFCDPKITAFFRIKLLVFEFYFWCYCDLARGAIQTIRLLALHVGLAPQAMLGRVLGKMLAR